MVQKIHYHSKIQGREHRNDQTKTETSWASFKLYIIVSDVKKLFRSPVSSSVDRNTLLSLGLLAALLGRYPMTLATLTSWVCQSNPGFNFTLSHNGLSTRPPFRDIPDTCLASVALFHNSFLLSLTLNPESCSRSCQILLLDGAGT